MGEEMEKNEWGLTELEIYKEICRLQKSIIDSLANVKFLEEKLNSLAKEK